MYEELVKRLREKAGAFDYDGRPDIACDYEQAADAIEKLSAEVLSNRAILKQYGDETGIKDLNEFAGKYWDTLAKIPRWISVKERLPEKCGCYYLVVLNNWNTDFCLYTKEKGFGMYITQKWWDANDEVTHWMPLPEPPKEET